MPCYNLKAMAKEIESDMPEPKTLFGAWKEMRATWSRQKIDPSYAFDIPVPTRVGTGFNASGTPPDEVMVNSIGDLAPKGSEIV